MYIYMYVYIIHIRYVYIKEHILVRNPTNVINVLNPSILFTTQVSTILTRTHTEDVRLLTSNVERPLRVAVAFEMRKTRPWRSTMNTVSVVKVCTPWYLSMRVTPLVYGQSVRL